MRGELSLEQQQADGEERRQKLRRGGKGLLVHSRTHDVRRAQWRTVLAAFKLKFQ